MNPALSVVFFTTLAGAGQGLLLALVAADWSTRHGWVAAAVDPGFAALGALIAAALATVGLAASFLHLGRPERAWRAATQWRTSWLSREVIVLPGFIALTLALAAAYLAGRSDWALPIGGLAALVALLLFLCTGMIYACMRFLREWATPLTPLNFTLLGCANGLTLAAALAALRAPALLPFFAAGAIAFTFAGLAGRLAAWRRNAALAPKSTLQTAIGIKHPRIEQKAQGFMGGSFNTREFFHGRSAGTLRLLRAAVGVLAFALPLLLLAFAVFASATPPAAPAPLLAAAALLQYFGLLAERWLFFAEAKHPQNLYYQRMS
ncbi:MAG TPA: dimethyl sulfoxide reductase anchor subunit [Rubrivivax sp.]|nr:dimethyl sulfoxide reductase anchor subunit [Rubrivivax sp.]